MKPLRNKLIQSRLDEDEMADFDKVKKLLGEENNLNFKNKLATGLK